MAEEKIPEEIIAEFVAEEEKLQREYEQKLRVLYEEHNRQKEDLRRRLIEVWEAEKERREAAKKARTDDDG